MSQAIGEPTFTGYISSTHDALLIFECVRRGIMPKVPRRLRDDERKLIRSGSVFVFDEHESGIKRWTDGLLWSPSRILWNFLVYRQIERKSSKGQDATASTLATSDLSIDPLAHGFGTGSDSAPSSTRTSPVQARLGFPQHDIKGRGRAVSSASDSASVWFDGGAPATSSQWYSPQSQGMSSSYNAAAAALPSHASHSAARREADLERALVGSLRNSYPFAKDGLCKKTISIQVDGSTQHLVSYYKVDDVRNGRLRTPLSLPEISGLHISPIILQKSNFRNPPDIEVMPDGSLRYRGDGSEASRRAGAGTGSGSDGSDGRSAHAGMQSPGMMNLGMDPRYYAGPDSVSIGGGGGFPRRLSIGTLSRDGRGGVTGGSRISGNSRYEPYSLPGSRPSLSMGTSGEASPMEAGGGSASWFGGSSSALGVGAPVRHRNTFSVRDHPGPFPLGGSGIDDGSSSWGGMKHDDSQPSPSFQNRVLPWTSAAQHTLAGNEALGRPRGATTGTWHSHSSHATLRDSFHTGGGGSSTGSSDAGFPGTTLGLSGMKIANGDGRPVSAHHQSHNSSGLPAMLGSNLDHQQQVAAHSASLENLAHSAGFRDPSAYDLKASRTAEGNMSWSPAAAQNQNQNLAPVYGQPSVMMGETPETSKYMSYQQQQQSQQPRWQEQTGSTDQQHYWYSNGGNEHQGSGLDVYGSRTPGRVAQPYNSSPQQMAAPSQQQQHYALSQQQHNNIDPSAGDLGPIMLTRPSTADRYGNGDGDGGNSSFVQ